MTKDEAIEHMLTAKRSMEKMITLNLEQEGRIAPRLDQTLVTVSSGALALSTAFIKDLTPINCTLSLLILSWIAFLICIVSVVLAMRHAQFAASDRAVDLGQRVERFMKDINKIAEMSDDEFQTTYAARTTKALFETTQRVTQTKTVKRRNLWAIIAFVIGIASFLAFCLLKTII